MKSVLHLALAYLRFNRGKTVILVFSIAAAIYLPLSVNLLVRDYQRDLLARAEATPLVAGAPGSRLDLVLHALYFRGLPARELSLRDVNDVNESGLAAGMPIVCKHTARGLPIVGTALEYFDFRGLSVAQGRGLTRLGDCVLGAGAASRLGLKPGDKLMSDPENVFDLAGSYPLNMHVAGVLAPSGTADDGAVFVDVKTAWLIQGLMHGHQEAAKADPALLLGRDQTNVTASAALLPYQEVTATNAASFHMHGDAASYPVGAVLISPHDEKSAAILRGRYLAPGASAQVLVPRQVVSETLELIFRVKRFFDAQALLVGASTALLLALVVLLSLRLRRGEMETMFKIGCARSLIFWLQAAEIAIVLAIGAGLAAGLSWITLREFGLGRGAHGAHERRQPIVKSGELYGTSQVRASGAEVGTALRAVRGPHGVRALPSQAQLRLTRCIDASALERRVAASNYPLEYFAERITGGHFAVAAPAAGADDPAFWEPTDEEIAGLQCASMILLNGAEYEKWLPAVVLPMTRLFDTSREFAGSYIANADVTTHSHGPGGAHSHGTLAFTLWLDLRQAELQAKAVHDGLIRLAPEIARDLDANWEGLKKDLQAMDATLAGAWGSEPLLASHPVYQYAARRYGWKLESVHWEPGELPPDAEWKKLAELHARHPARVMIWEAAPLAEVASRLKAMGIEPVVFDPCAGKPQAGDFLGVMRGNAERLKAAKGGA